MEVNVNCKPGNIKGVKEAAENKLIHLEKFEDKIERADVFYNLTKDPVNMHEVEIKLAVAGPDAFAKSNGETFEKAIIQCVEKLEKQLKKRTAYHHGRS